MKKMVLSLVAFMSAFVGLGASYEYDSAAAQRTLYVTVGKGDTEDLDASCLAPQGATVTNVVKRGEGKLRFASADIAAYTFDTIVREGICTIKDKSCFTKNACRLTVCDGATFQAEASGNNASIGNVEVFFEGRGYNGMGALYKTSYDWGSPFGKPTLTGDALVTELGTENSLMNVNLQGHTLDILFSTYFGNEWRTYSNMGTINFMGSGTGENKLVMSTWTTFTGDTRAMTLSNLVYHVSKNSYGNGCSFDFPLAFRANTSMRLTAQRDDSGHPNFYNGSDRNVWKGPVHIDEPRLPVAAQLPAGKTPEDVGFCFENKVSGGGLGLIGTDDVAMHFFLKDGANDFTGGVTAVNAVLHDYANGAVPAAGADLAFTNSSFLIENDGTYALPGAEFSGDCVVSNGFGRWNGALVKSGAGTLDYRSSLHADTLDVRGGSVACTADPAARSRAYVAGFRFDTAALSEEPATNDKDYASLTKLIKNGVQEGFGDASVTRGMDLFYTDAVLPSNRVFRYSGYVWNNTATNQVWAFAGTSTQPYRLEVDETPLVGFWNWSGTCMYKAGYADGSGLADIATNTIVLTPGPHRITCVLCCRYPNTGDCRTAQGYVGSYLNSAGLFRSAYQGDLYESWLNDVPFMYNDTGVCTRSIKDYKKLIDPGDGSVFTHSLPDVQRRSAVAGFAFCTKSPATDNPGNASSELAVINKNVLGGDDDGLSLSGHATSLDRFYASSGLEANTVYCYTGYIWNNTKASKTYAFAGDSTRAYSLYVDGRRLLSSYGWYGEIKGKTGYADGSGYADIATNTIVLAPGPHSIRCVVYLRKEESGNAQSYTGDYISTAGLFMKTLEGADYEQWSDNIPFMYNDTGVCTRNYKDYKKLTDPGDGSAFTYAIPEEGAASVCEVHFDAAKFAPGTSASFGGADQTFATLEGWPTTSDGDITLNGDWTIDPADVGVAPFTLDGKLTLGANARLVIGEGKPAKAYRNKELLLGTVTGGIVGTLAVEAGENWRVTLDGNRLKATYFGNGSVILVR